MKTLKQRPTHWVMTSTLTGLLAVSLVACNKPADSSTAPGTSTSLGQVVDDTVITTRVKSALMADAQISSYDFKVETLKGDVMLSGFVENQMQADAAAAIARAVEGVTNVQNNVTLKGATATVGNKVDDGIITGKVKAALMSESSIQSQDIAVVTRLDEVQLSGFVSNQQQIDKAMEIARSVQGVRIVTNEMKIKK